MESDKARGSGACSLARMKRRAKQMGKENSGVWLYSHKEGNEATIFSQSGMTSVPEKVLKRHSREDVSTSSDLRLVRPSNENLAVSANTKVPTRKDYFYSSVENVFSSRNSLSEKSVCSSECSIDYPTKPTHDVAVDKKSSPNPVKQSQKSRTLATLLPDEILSDPVGREPRSYHIAVMFPDVSGFTQLCQKYDKTGKGGPSRLTEVLNGYIGSMIDIVLSRNGDVYKFGGDAFLCIWKVTSELSIVEVAHSAIDSAVDIQKHCGEYKTDVGVKLGVKIAVSAGRALFSIIGTDVRKYYVVAGPPILEVRDAEQLCTSGDVIVAASAWKYVNNYMYYSYTYHSDNSHIKVHDFGPLWKPIKAGFAYSGNSMQSSRSRPILKFASRLKMEDIRPFILPPVMRSIDLDQSLDYLTEMRQVAIAFFNVAVDFKSIPTHELLKLTNKTFQIISGVVDKSDGATNKLTIFDKDMAVLTVFGLRGFKHDLASQVALRCAHNCVEQLKKLDVLSASVGVTTGMAYCGVIGHSLRKEYTVMGNPVNLAARLMCAYKNIVSSDRETFLYSKLESSHFEVLEQKNLKGIQSAGPFYKFILQPKLEFIRFPVRMDIKDILLDAHLIRKVLEPEGSVGYCLNKRFRRMKTFHEDVYPLLGRGKEINEFELFLKNSAMRDRATNFMVIFGKARIGKSRLVERLINITEKYNTEGPGTNKRVRLTRKKIYSLDACLISLTEDNYKVSYSGIRLIFQQLMGLSELSTVEERQDKILSKLNDVRNLFLLASLNPIFNVNFDLMPQYLALTEEEQIDVQLTLIKTLYSGCIPKSDKWLIVIDDAEFLDEESWNLLRRCFNKSDNALFLLTIGQRKVLSPAALECLEIVKAKKITLTEIEKWYYAGLACQILGVKAVPVELINLLQKYKSSGNPGWLESFLLSLLQSGRIYTSQVSYEKAKTLGLVAVPEMMLARSLNVESEKFDSSYWFDCLETFEPMSENETNKRVCLLGPNFFIGGDKEMELTMDVMFIKIIDTLKPLEQLVLKAGSVLGNNLKRSALKFLVSKDKPILEKQLARAIKHLFEMKILTCAKGDLTQSNFLIPRNMIPNISIKKEVSCECTGIIIPPECKDLPRYANCGYMQFRSSTFRDTLYNLLLDEQKKKFHNSCIEFLTKNTFKCKSCDNVPFTNVLGYEKDPKGILACTKSPVRGVRATILNPKSVFPIPSLRRKLTSCSFLNTVHRLRNSGQNSDNDLSLISALGTGDCQCSKILSSVYSVMLEHAAGCGRKDILLEIHLEYASVSLTSYNIPLTMQILEEALSIVNQMKEEKEYPEFCSPYIYGKIYTLMGATKLSMGRPSDSLELLMMCLKYLKKNFPGSDIAIKYAIRKQTFKRRLMIEFPESYIGRISDNKAPLTDLLSECLGLISLVHIYLQNWMKAKYASVWALNKALQSNRNFFGLCTAYTNIMDIAYRENDGDTCARMEICAIDTCKRCSKNIIEVYELEAVCRLYRVIFQTRHMRAEIEEAAQIGFQSIKIASTIRSTTLRLDLMPDLILALIQLNRLSEAVALMHELEFMSLPESDKSSRVWYYAICLDFQLDTGFTVLPFETCEEFAKEEENLMLVRDPNAKHRLFTSLWLWCVRNDEWELSKTYVKELKNFSVTGGKDNPCNVSTLLKRLEGCLITLVHRMDSRNIYSINATYSEVHSLLNTLDRAVKAVKLLRPRYQLLKAYYRQIRYRDNSYFRIFSQALLQAEKMKDKNTSQWIVHVKMVWSNAISPIQRDYWLEHCRHNLIDWHESDKVVRAQTVMYSLPLPKF